MTDHPHPQVHSKSPPALPRHWNRNKYDAKLAEGAQKLERGHVGFGSSIRTGKFDSRFWEVVELKGATESEPCLRLIRGKKPSDAIDEMFKNPGFWSFDCAEFVQAVELFAILNTVGPDIFNAKKQDLLFRQHGSTGLAPKDGWEFDEKGVARRYPKGTAVGRTLDHQFKESPNGSEVTFKNTDPLAKGRVYEFENTIKLGPDLFIAHGIGGDGIVTRTEIESVMATDALRRAGRSPDGFYIKANIRINSVVLFDLR